MRWHGWSARGLLPLAWPGALLWAVAAERAAYTGADVRRWLPDLATGLVVTYAGLYAVQRGSGRCGVLLTLCGALWFLPNFATAPGVMGALAGQCLFLYRGPVVHLLLAFPTGRLATRTERVTAAAGYVIALDPRVWGSALGTVLASTVLGFVLARSLRTAPGRYRRARVLAMQVAAALGLVLLGIGLVRKVAGAAETTYPTLVAFEVVFAGAAVVLATALASKAWERVGVIDLLLEDRHGGTLRDALAWTLGDPSLRLWFAKPSEEVQPGSSERTEVVDDAGHPVATIAHRPGLLAEPAVLAAVIAAVRLGAQNALLQRELEARVDEVAASRRRLLSAADDEADRLERRLTSGPLQKLMELDDLLDDSVLGDALAAAIADLRELAHGLHPRVLAERGLVPAVRELADRCPIPVEVEANPVRLPVATEATAYFVCSEAIANVVKHAWAASARVAIWSSDGGTCVQVSDDGAGGADLGAGSGLRGLADRLEAVGGILSVESRPGAGTRVRAVIPS